MAKRAEKNVVARLAVQVSPDTDGFRRELNRQLEVIEKTIPPVEIGVDIDQSRLLRNMDEMIARADSLGRQVSVGVDEDYFARSLTRLADSAEDARHVDIGTHIDRRVFDDIGRMRTALDDVAQRSSEKLSDAYSGDLDQLRRRWRATLDQMRRDAVKKMRLPGSKMAEDQFGVLGSGLTFTSRREDLATAGWVRGRGEALREALARLGPVEFEMRPDDSWKKNTRGLLDGFFRKEYVGNVRWQVSADDALGEGELHRLKRRMDREFGDRANWKYKVDIDVDVPTGQVDRALNRMRQVIRQKAFGHHELLDLDIHADMSVDDMRKVNRKLKKFKEQWDDTELEFHLSLDHSDRYVAAARLALLARDRWVKLKPIVDSKAYAVAAETLAALTGFRLAKDFTKNIWDMVKNLDKAVPVFGAVASGLAVAASAVTVLAKHTLTVGAGLVHAVEAVGLLAPGIAASGLVLAASFIVPLRKIKEYVAGIGDDFTSLGESMASSFWDEALTPFRAAYETVFPEFRKGLESTSAAAGRHLGRVAESMAAVLKPRLGSMFAHAARAMDVLGAHSDSLMRVLGVLGEHGSAGLERMAAWLGEATDSWARWLTEAERTGRLQEVIDRGVEALNALGRAAKNTFRLFSGLAKVADEHGGATLGMFADGIGRWAEAVESAGFKRGFGDLLAGMTDAWNGFKKTMGHSVGEFASSISRTLRESGGLMGTAGGLFGRGVLTAVTGPAFNRGFKDFFSGLVDGLRRLDSVWPRVSKGVGALLSFMGSLARGFAPVVETVLRNLSRAAERLGPVLSRVVESAGPKMAHALDIIGRTVTPIVEGLARLVELLAKIPGGVEAFVLALAGGRFLFGAASGVVALARGFSGLAADAVKTAGALRVLRTGGGLANAARAWGDTAEAAKALEASSVGAAGGVGRFAGAARGALGVLGPLAAAIGVATVAWGAYTAYVDSQTSEANENIIDQLRRVGDGSREAGKAIESSLKQYDFGKRMKGVKFNTGDLGAMLAGDSLVQKASQFYFKYADGVNFAAKSLAGFNPLLHGAADGMAALSRAVANGADLSKAGALGKDLTGWFKQIGEVASSGEVAQAAEQVRVLGQAWRNQGGDGEVFNQTLGRMLDSMPDLEAGLASYARQMGYATDRQSLLNMVSGQTNLVWAQMAHRSAAAESNVTQLGAALDGVASQFGLTHGQAQNLVKIFGEVGPTFMNMSEAIVDANGNAVASIEDVVANLESQAAAQAKWAENVTLLAKSGLADNVLSEFSRLPGAAQYMQQLADMLRDPSEQTRQQAQELIDRLNGVSPAFKGIADSAGSDVARMLETVGGSFDTLKQNVVSTLEQLGVDASVTSSVAGADTVDALAKALADGDISLLNSADGLRLKLDGKWYELVDGARSHGTGIAQGLAEGIEAGSVGLPEVGAGLARKVFDGVSVPTPEGGVAGVLLGQAVANGVIQSAPDGTSAGAALSRATVSGITSERFDAPGRLQGGAFARGVGNTSQKATDAGRSIGQAGKNGAAGVSYSAAGRDAGQGFANGIAAKIGAVAAVGTSLGLAALNAAKAILGIHSPSREFRKVGAWSVEGYVAGVNALRGEAVDTADELFNDVVEASKRSSMFQVFDGGKLGVDVDNRGESVLRVDADSFRGAQFTLRVSDQDSFDSYVSDVSDQRIIEYASVS
ncbi:hypothetical protein [Schaalia sp. ZJ1691]|uniref:phage tail protein n=1 Tax=Schaalia sp. ZJ1691 TaxID=2709404 RepID=UPI0013EC3D07|nr:hypothetical protein [Schaalia sp. ZJ1691]